MRPFAFRAEMALTLRRRQEDEAQRALAAAESRARTAEEVLARAQAVMGDALRLGGEEDARAGDPTIRMWYRNWITGQRLHVERCARVLDARRAETAQAAERAQLARRRRKSLERLRHKAFGEWAAAGRREEQRAIDELATMRHARGDSGDTGGRP